MVVIITLHNLSQRSSGLANQEFFHFRSHITSFIDKNWNIFFPNESRRKRKNLLGTVAGMLSQHSPGIFSSGTETVRAIGWWKLTQKWSPSKYEKFLHNKAKRSSATEPEDEDVEIDAKRLKVHEDDDLDVKENCTDNEFCEDTEDEQMIRLNDDLITSNSAESLKNFQLDIELTHNDAELIKLNHPKSISYTDMHFDESEEILDIEELTTSRVFPANSKRQTEIVSVLTTVQNDDSILKTANIKQKPELLDRYRVISKNHQQWILAGPTLYERFHSPLSGRILQPFIYRDKKTFPRWLQVMCEIKFAVSGKAPERSSIDFCFARPNHLPAVNSLLQRSFWPGIDMSESLNYPDYTVVALYKKLVVGCAFLVPDACHNEAYISFLAVQPGWDRCGIASFMLYHLTQTSHGKDITLHVSASNPAICLYQKFGFKTEEFVLGFYDKYLPPDSPHSPHALFLRLVR